MNDNRHVFKLNEDANGGEALLLTTEFVKTDGEISILSQELGLNSYGNSASFQLSKAKLTPELLRKLANELDAKMSELNFQTKLDKLFPGSYK